MQGRVGSVGDGASGDVERRGGHRAGEAEQALLDRALKELSFLFTANRIWIMDRNFPGHGASGGC